MIARNMNISDYENMGVGQVIDVLKELNNLNKPKEKPITDKANVELAKNILRNM
ncbi:MAG: hypothetical protein ACRCZK_01715 [Oscillospiraceae bacterium]